MDSVWRCLNTATLTLTLTLTLTPDNMSALLSLFLVPRDLTNIKGNTSGACLLLSVSYTLTSFPCVTLSVYLSSVITSTDNDLV